MIGEPGGQVHNSTLAMGKKGGPAALTGKLRALSQDASYLCPFPDTEWTVETGQQDREPRLRVRI